jgi:HK97 family phage prohead protease
MKTGFPEHFPDHLTLDDWKALALKGEAPEASHLLKQYVAEIEKAEGEASRKLTFVITTGSVDRDRDVLRVEGWNLEAYVKNPVVLWAHMYGMPPVGKAETMLKKAKSLRATAEFATAEEYAFADTIFRLLKGGYLRATSVGFRPIKWSYNEDRRGYDFEEQELLEFSIVPVPANAEALVDAKAAGIPIEHLRDWAIQVLDGMEPGLWVPKATALRALELATGERETVVVAGETKTPSGETNPLPAETKDPSVEPPASEPTFADSLPPFLRTPEGAREAIRGALSDVATSAVNRARGRLD